MVSHYLVTLEDLKLRLGFDFHFDDEALILMLDEAQDHVLSWVDDPATPWAADTAPLGVKSGIILTVARLYATRGGEEGEILTPAIKALLRRFRKTVVA